MSNRRTKIVTIGSPPGSRDMGKSFLITEMPAFQGESWGTRAFHAIVAAGGDVDGYVPGAGLEALAIAGYKSFGQIDYATAQPLWDELMTCVRRVEDPSRPEVSRPLVESDIDEISTIITLKFEAFSLLVNFSKAAAGPTSQAQGPTSTTEPSSSSTPTSPPSSGPSFHPARRPSRSSPRRSA